MKNNTYKTAFYQALAVAVAASAIVIVEPTTANATPLEDVTSNNVHYADIMKLVEGKQINGFEDGIYLLGISVTRGQAAKIIANVLGIDTTNVVTVNFKDIAKSNIYQGPIAALEK